MWEYDYLFPELYPNEADVHEIIGCVEETTAKGMVKLNTFIKWDFAQTF